jgi:protein-tyrosine phosphatase
MEAPNMLNLRELGGLPLQSGDTTRMRSLLRADTLDRLSEEGMLSLADYGLRTIIDLRWPEEVRTGEYGLLLAGLPVQRRHISLLKSSEAEWRQFRLTNEPKAQLNCVALAHTAPQMLQIMRAIAHAPEGVVLFHCHSGKDRTGLVSTLLLELAGVELDAMVHDYTVSEDLLRDGYLADRADLSQDEIQQRLHCPPQQVTNTLSYLTTHHAGVEGYLQFLGLTLQEIHLIRSRLVEDNP